MRPWRCLSLGLDAVSLGLLFREKIRRRRGNMRRRRGGRCIFAFVLERIEVLALQFGQFPDVMPFARGENED